MAWSYLNVVLFMFILLHQYQPCFGCVEKERFALLELKASIDNTDYFSWEDENCCEWDRVVCSNVTSRVIQISLDMAYLFANSDDPFLNVSLFLPFEELQYLDLSYNRFGYYQNYQGFEDLARLTQLEVLNLSFSEFNKSILPSLGKLTSLKVLDLSSNLFGQESHQELAQVIKALNLLEALSLKDNNLTGSITGFCELVNLRELDLSANSYRGVIPQCFNNMTSLKALYLSRNHFQGNIPSSFLSSLTSLSLLDMSYNNFSGTISPSLLSNQKFLRILDLSHNQLRGNVPMSFLSNFVSLEYVSFSNNQFEGFTFSTTLSDSINFQLRGLDISNCSLRIPTTELLSFLYDQHELRFIDLSSNHIHGTFPNWLVENNTNLEILRLYDNLLSGHIQISPNVTVNLMKWFDVSDNNIQGQLQTNIGDIFPSLQRFDMSKNDLEGRIPLSLGNMKILKHLDLSNNNFTGDIPESLVLCEQLFSLILSNNRLDGQVPPFLLTFPRLTILRLSNNQLVGSLSADNVTQSVLEIFDASQNSIRGRLPAWVGNLTSLRLLSLRRNSFVGPIPDELCNLVDINFFELSENNFSGFIPSCLNLTSLKYMHLRRNKLIGTVPRAILQSSHIQTLDISYNDLSGHIPNWLGLLRNLRILLLKGNQLNASIPHELCQLDSIAILDLSRNKFSGTIPSCFSNFTFENTYVLEHGTRDEGQTIYGKTLGGVSYEGLLWMTSYGGYSPDVYVHHEEIEFMTKSRPSLYKGDILNFMAGMDLSSNHLTGDIPLEVGTLTGLRALNLSYNQFTGPIPKTMSKLLKLESLDLSHNNLRGEIPSELVDINSLSFFSVAYNNLSGIIPDKAQFSTFGVASYQGNPFLQAPEPSPRSETNKPSAPHRQNGGFTEKYGIDVISLYSSAAVSYVITLLGLVLVLYINRQWRRMWFEFIDTCLHFMFPFWSDAYLYLIAL